MWLRLGGRPPTVPPPERGPPKPRTRTAPAPAGRGPRSAAGRRRHRDGTCDGPRLAGRSRVRGAVTARPLRQGGGGPRPRRGACARPPGGGARLPRACGLRRPRAPAPRRPRARRGGVASSSCAQRSSSSRRRASASALARASRSWSESVRSTTPERGAFERRAADVRRDPAARPSGRRSRGSAGPQPAAARLLSSTAPPGATGRRLTVSTTTAFERPWEKLWRTMPCSTGRFRDSVLGDTWRVLSPGFFVSVIPLRSCGLQNRGFAGLGSEGGSRLIGFDAAISSGNDASGSESRRFQRPRRGQHVSHVTGLMPNPIRHSTNLG